MFENPRARITRGYREQQTFWGEQSPCLSKLLLWWKVSNPQISAWLAHQQWLVVFAGRFNSRDHPEFPSITAAVAAVRQWCQARPWLLVSRQSWLYLLRFRGFLHGCRTSMTRTSTTISAQAPYSVIISSRLYIPEQTWSWSHKFPYIKARKCNIWVRAQVWHWKSFLFEEKSGSPLKCPGHSFGVSQQTCLSSTEGWRHKSNIRGLREWLPGIYESIRLHFLLKAKNNRQPLHAAVGFSSFH